MPKQAQSICYLCGEQIAPTLKDGGMELSWDHVPPKQFFPKELREEQKVNLQGASSHKRCNNQYKSDEEYFYHSLYPLVANNNPAMARTILGDLARRCQKPQSRVILRSVFSQASSVSKGGIILPARKVEFTVDLSRIERIAGKVARGALFLATGASVPETSIIDMRICEDESEVPEMYRLSWQATKPQGSYPKVFSYKYMPFEDYHIISLLFWEAFMFCVTMQTPSRGSGLSTSASTATAGPQALSPEQ